MFVPKAGGLATAHVPMALAYMACGVRRAGAFRHSCIKIGAGQWRLNLRLAFPIRLTVALFVFHVHKLSEEARMEFGPRRSQDEMPRQTS